MDSGNFPFSHSKYISFLGIPKCKQAIDCSNGSKNLPQVGKLKYFNELILSRVKL